LAGRKTGIQTTGFFNSLHNNPLFFSSSPVFLIWIPAVLSPKALPVAAFVYPQRFPDRTVKKQG